MMASFFHIGMIENRFVRQRTTAESRQSSVSRRQNRKKKCNICGKPFRNGSVHARFCDSCKTSSELYRFHDTLLAS